MQSSNTKLAGEQCKLHLRNQEEQKEFTKNKKEKNKN